MGKRKPPIDLEKIPPTEAQRVGGPFDGNILYFTPGNWEENESRYGKFYEEGIIEDVTCFSRNFPEGAVYRWDSEKKHWQYVGIPNQDSQDSVRRLFRAFDIEPEKPL